VKGSALHPLQVIALQQVETTLALHEGCSADLCTSSVIYDWLLLPLVRARSATNVKRHFYSSTVCRNKSCSRWVRLSEVLLHCYFLGCTPISLHCIVLNLERLDCLPFLLQTNYDYVWLPKWLRKLSVKVFPPLNRVLCIHHRPKIATLSYP
jgi:hypothetical protein